MKITGLSSGWWVYPELNINPHEVMFCNYDEEEKYIFLIADSHRKRFRKERGRMAYHEQDGR